MPSVSERLPDFALLGRELIRCGWKESASGPLEGELFFQTAQGGVTAPSQLYVPERGGESLLLLDLSGAESSRPDDLYARFLDFSLETRMALSAARLVASARHVALMSAERIELFRLPSETLEHRASSLREFEDELLPALAARTRSRRAPALSTLPHPLDSAATLRGWLAHWARQISTVVGAPPEDCEKFVWKLILMLQLARKMAPSEVLGGWGLSCEKLGSTWTLAYDSIESARDIVRALEAFDHTFSTRIFSGDAELYQDWFERLEETSLLEQMRAELLMQAQLKFEAESVAWMFTAMEVEQEGWKREALGLGPIRGRFQTEGWTVLQPLVCDVGRDGLTFALREAERLAEHWRDYDLFARARDPRRVEDLYTQPDLFKDAPRGVSPLNQLDDGLNFLFGESLRLTGAPPEAEFGVGVTFLLQALELARAMDWPFFGVDTLDMLWRVD